MSVLGQKWTKAERKAASIRMKAAYAKKKLETATPSNLYNDSSIKVPIEEAKAQQAQFDQHRFGEYQYRRGLIAAMECILRELR